jgi:fused signal recognition particle receptor
VKKEGLGSKIKRIFSSGGDHEEFLEELEDVLVEGDIGARTAMEIIERIEAEPKSRKSSREDIENIIREILKEYIRAGELELSPEDKNLVLVLGVNGVGKTTTIAKLARYFQKTREMDSVLAAADTFRAAAIDQLSVLGQRLDMRVVKQNPGADPGAVIYDAIESARHRGDPLIFADTAGRMHNKANLVRELQKIDKIVHSRFSDGVYRKLLVIDATTGQNGLRQAELFHDAVGLDGVVLAKYDSASKGGIVISICRDLGLPFFFMGTGEGYDDLEVFDADRFIDLLLGK